MKIRKAAYYAIIPGCLVLAATDGSAATITSFGTTWQETDVRPGGTAEIVDLAGTGGDLENNAPLGTGVARVTTDSTNAAKAEVGAQGNYGKVSDVLDADFGLGFSWYSVDDGDAAAPSIKLEFYNAAYDSAPGQDGYGQLVFEPYLQPGGLTVDSWQDSVISMTDGLFWSSGMFGSANDPGGVTKTLADWKSSLDPAFLDATLTGVLVGIGTYNPDEIGYFDNVRISGTELDATYDFEAAAPVPLPAGIPLLLTGLGGLVALRRRKANT